MKMYYIANARIPTEKAHGLTIVKSCEAFARAGAEVVLMLPRRKTQFEKDIFDTYGVEKNFTVRYVPMLDLLRFSSARLAFWVAYATFYISVFFVLLRMPKKNAVLYTRDAPFLLLTTLGLPAILESHHVFSKSATYFWLARRAKGIIVISHALKEKFMVAGFDEKNVLVQPSGVELSTFSKETPQSEARQTLELPQDKKIIAYTGNFTTMGMGKGISDILCALTNLPDIFFVAAGGSEKDRGRYQAEAENLGVAGRTTLEGYAPQKILALYQRAADVLLMPFPDTPHYRSNMSPVKMFEYMASGRPIIASNLPTIREVLNETNAVIVPSGNPPALADAVDTLLKEFERGNMLAAQAKKDVQIYNWDERTKRILSFVKVVSS